jgi:hypothetical protein
VNDPAGQVVITGSDRGSVQVVEHLTYPGLPPVTTHSSQGGTLEDASSGHVINARAGTGSVTITSG